MSKKVIITGGTGFIGKALCAALLDSGYEVVVLSRDPQKTRGCADSRISCARWDGRTAQGWLAEASGAYAIVNLAGENIAASLRWTKQTKHRLLQSRLNAGTAVSLAVAQADPRPRVVIQASAIGYYGDRGDCLLNEASSGGSGFLADVARQWEATTARVQHAGVRHVIIRTGIVLGRNGGFLSRVALPFYFFLGGHPGSGRQWLSWIHMEDEAAAIKFLIERDDLAGTFNLTAPVPLQAKDFFHLMGTQLHRPSWLHIPAWCLRAFFGEMAREVLLASQRVMPERLLQSGFSFRYPDALQALSDSVA